MSSDEIRQKMAQLMIKNPDYTTNENNLEMGLLIEKKIEDILNVSNDIDVNVQGLYGNLDILTGAAVDIDNNIPLILAELQKINENLTSLIDCCEKK